ncbi:polysaccharide biosynthesis C-terminal domain-containing protein [Patescibacteria group bacterium]|nr:polysaccharide biosynthesis C-terminal domain-containing protein [Patescibacteria group bacterium]MBU1256599.1 polysaccharide biosynthesis C-terminal domain-containing protein [Patescibacteria group bacterium]MBU1457468.1 polysaccharide biosynthesis C-terminal domain-containing protein [Patescibacteria group bacterium]
MSIKKTLLKNSSINLLGYGYLLLLSFFAIPMLLKSLGADTFGVYLVYAGLIPLASTLNFGLTTALVRYLSLPSISKHKKTLYWQTCLWQFIVLSLAVFLLSLLINLLVINKLVPVSLLTSILISLIIFVNHLSQPFQTLPQVDQNFAFYNLRNLIVGTGTTILTAFLALYYPSLPHIFAFQLVLHIITGLVFFKYATNKFTGKNVWPKFSRPASNKLINFGFKNFIGSLASQLRNQFSKFALAGMLNPQAVTIFTIPQTIIIKAAGAISQLTLSFFPLSTSLSSKERIGKLQKLILGIQGLVLFLGILQVYVVHQFGLSFLIFWLKDVDLATKGFSVLKILSIFFVLTSLTPIPSVVLDGINKPQIPSMFAVSSAVLNIILIFLLTPQYGFLGPAYATTISSIVVAPLFLITFTVIFKRYKYKLTHD